MLSTSSQSEQMKEGMLLRCQVKVTKGEKECWMAKPLADWLAPAMWVGELGTYRRISIDDAVSAKQVTTWWVESSAVGGLRRAG